MKGVIHISLRRGDCMIPRAVCKPDVRLLLAISAILCICHFSAYAQTKSQSPHLVFSTYLGGSIPCGPGVSPLTFAQNAASDSLGNTYVTGATQVYDLPVLNAWQPKPAAESIMSAFVAKYDPAGKMLWCTYLGGDGESMGVGVAAMPDGGVAVAGLTNSVAPGFPVMNAFQPDNNGQSDYFVSVFDANGNMRYSTYLGGSGVEGTPNSVFSDDNSNGNNVAADAHGLVYITGATSSAGGTKKFPVTQNALQPDLAGKTDAFLCIIDPGRSGQSSLVYSSFLGGTGDEKGHGIAVNSAGSQITVGGYTNSLDFPTTDNAYRSTHPPVSYTSNGFITRFTSSLPGELSSHYAMSYSTYLGADSVDARDDTYGLVLDSKGLIIATGRTQSSDFPMTDLTEPSIYNSAPYLKKGTSNDEPYLVKIDPSLNCKASLVYSTFLGGGSPTPGGGGAFCTSAAAYPDGTVYVAGETSSLGIEYTPSGEPVEAPSLLPYTNDALFPALQGNYDSMLMRISPDGSTLAYSTFLGGKENDRTYGLTVDPFGGVIMTGLTFSADFPLENAAQVWPGNAGCQNAFVAKFSSGGDVPAAPSCVSAAPVIGGGAATVSFAEPLENGSPIQFYTATSYPGGVKAASTASPITVCGLTNGTTYAFTVKATNGAGTGPASAASNKVTPSTVPGKPAIEKAVRGNGQATVYFAAPAAAGKIPGNGGSPITSYTVTSDPEGITVTRNGGSTGPVTVTGLTYNISYTFRVTATNANGSGAPSDPSAPVTPTVAVPGAPAAVIAVRDGSQSLSVSFTAPSANGSKIKEYIVTSYPGGITGAGVASPIKITGLTNGTAYAFRVTATNAVGTGPASALSPYVIPAVAPDAPTDVTAMAGKLQATIAFKAPAFNGGMPITSYTVTSDPEGIKVTRASSPIIVSGLRNLQYKFNLTATNAVGTGKPISVSATPAAVKPGAPTGVYAIRSSDIAGGNAFVYFTPPKSDGGTEITGYTAISYPGGITSGGNTNPLTVTGLTNGAAYAFSVTATNAVGTGPASARSARVTPATLPFAPEIGTVVKGNGQATVYFTAPAAAGGVPGNGGSPITSYTVTSEPEGISITRDGSSTGPITVTGLTGNKPYTFTVTAANSVGKSTSSSASDIVTPTAAIPGAPSAVTATPGDGQATVSFTAPLENGSPIQSYTVLVYPGAIPFLGPASSPITVTGLTNGTACVFRLAATNAVGTGPVSAVTVAVTPSTVPGKPAKVQAVRGNGQATVSFTAPAAEGGVPGNGGSPITSYTVFLDGGFSVTRAASPITVTGLENGTEYIFKVWANNKNGKGAVETSNAVTPAALPGAPDIDGTESGNTQVTVLFTAPAIDGGSPITKYTVISSPGGKTATAASSPVTVTGLTNGTAYTFTVKATNDVGTGIASMPSGKAIPGAAGWVIGNDTGGTAVILHTADGGAEWTVQGNNSLWKNHTGNDISAIDGQTAWAALGSSDAEGGIILHTADGGRSWNAQTLPVQIQNGGVKGIKGVSRAEAWAVGMAGPLMHTVNGGRTWTAVSTGDVVFKQVNRIDVLGSDIWIADRGNEDMGMIHSPDNGKTWRQEYLPDVTSNHGPMAIAIVNSSVAWTSVNYQGDIYRTTDGGLNWDVAAPNVSGANDIDDLCAIGINTVWGIQNIDSTDGYIMRVTVTGSGVVKDSWSFTDYVYEGVSAFDENNAWVGGFRGMDAPASLPRGSILHTSNGKDWTPQTLPVNDVAIWKLSFAGAKR